MNTIQSAQSSTADVICLGGYHSQHVPYCKGASCWCHLSDQWHAHIHEQKEYSQQEVQQYYRDFGIFVHSCQ